jgi:hypothetical protein
VSFETAELLENAGKGHWLTEREDLVFAKGKGCLKTYWLDTSTSPETQKAMSNAQNLSKLYMEDPDGRNKVSPVLALKEQNHNKRTERLINWCVDVFAGLLRGIVAKRQGQVESQSSPDSTGVQASARGIVRKNLLEEVRDVIMFPEFDHFAKGHADPDSIELHQEVEQELRDFICVIADLYQRNPFHNFEHAGHVLLSVCKLFTRIMSSSASANDDLYVGGRESAIASAIMHDNTFGIA